MASTSKQVERERRVRDALATVTLPPFLDPEPMLTWERDSDDEPIVYIVFSKMGAFDANAAARFIINASRAASLALDDDGIQAYVDVSSIQRSPPQGRSH